METHTPFLCGLYFIQLTVEHIIYVLGSL